jgi:hypothetical protein
MKVPSFSGPPRLAAVVVFSAPLALILACGTEPDPSLLLSGVWTGVEEVELEGVEPRIWEFVVIDVPPDEIWGTVRWGRPADNPNWSQPEDMTGRRDGGGVLEWGPRSQNRDRYEVDEHPVQGDADRIEGTLVFVGDLGQRAYSLSLRRVRQ